MFIGGVQFRTQDCVHLRIETDVIEAGHVDPTDRDVCPQGGKERIDMTLTDAAHQPATALRVQPRQD